MVKEISLARKLRRKRLGLPVKNKAKSQSELIKVHNKKVRKTKKKIKKVMKNKN